MSTPFDDAMDAVDAVVTKTFAKPVLILPMIKREMTPPGPDPARPPAMVLALFMLRPAADTLQGVRKGTELNGMTRMSVGVAELWIEPALLAALSYPVRVGDRITLTEAAGTPSYEIARAEPTDLAEGKFPLVRVKI